jgi:hypothetical protein
MKHKNCKLDPVQGHTDGDYGFLVRAEDNKLLVDLSYKTEARAEEARAMMAKLLEGASLTTHG